MSDTNKTAEETFEFDTTALSKKDQLHFMMLLNSGVKIKSVNQSDQTTQSLQKENEEAKRLISIRQKQVEKLIDSTPSGDKRNLLCDENIELLSFLTK